MKLYEPVQKRFFLFLAAFCLSILLFLFSLQIFLYNPRYYDHQYAVNGVYQQLGYDQTWNATSELWNYMQFRSEFTSPFFSSRDQLHMVDVRLLFLHLNYVLYVSVIILLVTLLYQYTFHRKEFVFFVFDLLYSSSSLSFFFIVFFLLLGVFFDYSFALFHRLFFSNNYWLLDPAVDKLVVLYPEAFFQNIFFCIILVAFLLSGLMFWLSFHVQKKYL